MKDKYASFIFWVVVFFFVSTDHHDAHEVRRIMRTLEHVEYEMQEQSIFNFIKCPFELTRATKVLINDRPAMICGGHFIGGDTVISIE